MDTNNVVVLVDEKDNIVGYGEKMDVHRKGLLHRAFSVLVFNKKGELLSQQRAKEKYHCGGLWTNTVCSHPKPGETYEDAVHRRLKEEFGFDCEIEYKFDLLYKASFENGLIENEFDKVYAGYYDGAVAPDENEIMAYKRVAIEELKKHIKSSPEKYTAWFMYIIQKRN